jgi:hypothetical protein
VARLWCVQETLSHTMGICVSNESMTMLDAAGQSPFNSTNLLLSHLLLAGVLDAGDRDE